MLRLRNSVKHSPQQDGLGDSKPTVPLISYFISSRASHVGSEVQVNQKASTPNTHRGERTGVYSITTRREQSSKQPARTKTSLQSRTQTHLELSDVKIDQGDEPTRFESTKVTQRTKLQSRSTSTHLQEHYHRKHTPQKVLSNTLSDLFGNRQTKPPKDKGFSFEKSAPRSQERSRLSIAYRPNSFWEEKQPKAFSLTKSQGYLLEQEAGSRVSSDVTT